MYQVGGAEILGLVLIIWLGVLTFLFFRERRYLQELFPKSGERDIRNKFKELIRLVEDFDKRGQLLEEALLKQKKRELRHLQRIAIERYNPYNDTGGDQSFTAVLLDAKLNGLLFTSLHSRAGTRVYAKSISSGVSDLDLSKEEKEILKKVINQR